MRAHVRCAKNTKIERYTMPGPIPGAGLDFFPELLSRVADAFEAGDICIVECVDKKSGEHCKALALIQLNKTNRKLEFYPIARLYDSNPMEGMRLADGGAVLASQRPMSQWIAESKKEPIDSSQMN